MHAGGQRFDPARLHQFYIVCWRNTQVRLKGSVLKTDRRVKPRRGSNPLSSSIIFIVAGWSSPVARRAHNPKVAGSNPAPAIAGPVVQLVRMPACHAGGRGFESRPDRHIYTIALNGSVAQLVEQRTENPCVGGSIPS